MRAPDRLPRLIALRAEQPPTIDGKLDELIWETAAYAGGFATKGPNPHPTHARTRVRLAWDERALYVAASLSPALTHPAYFWDPRTRASFAGQSLDLLLDPEHAHRHYVSISLHADGATTARRQLHPAMASADSKPELIRCAVMESRRMLDIEAEIPWQALGFAPQPGDCWAINFLRRGAGEGEDPSQWAPSYSNSDIEPTRFGELWFGEPELEIHGLRWDRNLLGRNVLRLWLRAQRPTRGWAVIGHETPFCHWSSAAKRFEIRPGDTLLELPYVIRQSGRGVLSLRLLAPDDTVLYATTYPVDAQPLTYVEGLGELEFIIPHRVYGCGEPVRVEVCAARFEPQVTLQYPIRWQLMLLDGLQRVVQQGPEVRADAARLRCLRLREEFELRGETAHEYVVRLVGSDANGQKIARVDCAVSYDPPLMAQLGMPWLYRFCQALRQSKPEDTWHRARHAEPMLALRLENAWRKLEEAPFDRLELGQSFWQAWQELDPGWRMAEEIAAGRVPLFHSEGTFFGAYRSSVDDSLQPFGLYVPPMKPPQPKPDEDSQPPDQLPVPAEQWPPTSRTGHPLLLSLHGWDGANRGFRFPEGPNHPYKLEAAKRGWLVVWPFGRGNQDWRDSGETDVLEVIDTVDRLLGVDRSRIYVSGVSMGGRGTWHLTMRRPSLWAAGLPIAGAAIGSVWGVWNEERLTANLTNLPMFIVHGSSDETVPVDDARRLVDSLDRLGCPYVYREEEGGHGGFTELAPEYFKWLAQHRLDPHPLHVHLETDSLRWSTAYWLQIEAIHREEQLASLDARILERNWLYVACDKVSQFSLRLGGHPAIDPHLPVQVVINGEIAYENSLPPDRTLRFRLTGDAWTPVQADSFCSRLVKRPGLQGPMRDATASRFLFVYGTRGNDPEQLAANFHMARHAAQTWREWWWGEPRVKADTELTPQDIADSNLLLYGGPDTNSFCAAIADQVPILDGKPISTLARPPQGRLTFKLIYPNPLNRQRYVLIFAGPTPMSQVAIGNAGEVTPWPVAMGMLDTDYAIAEVDEWDVVRPVLEGSFDADWQWPPAPPELLCGTGTDWLTSAEYEAGWETLDFDDSDWQRVHTRFRKELDDACWVPSTLQNFRRLRPQFLEPVMVIWHPPESQGWARYFRKTFHLQEVPEKAMGRLWLKDYGALYVNARQVHLAYEADGVHDFELTPYLRVGRNVIAIRAGAAQAERGVLFQCVREGA